MRGEEGIPQMSKSAILELPPHARRRADLAKWLAGLEGITSACAEKSCRLWLERA